MSTMHPMRTRRRAAVGAAVCAVVAEQETGVLKGGADPRRPSYALGL